MLAVIFRLCFFGPNIGPSPNVKKVSWGKIQQQQQQRGDKIIRKNWLKKLFQMTYTCISSPFSNQGLPAVTSNEFFVYTPLAPMFAHCLYNNYSYMYSHLKFEISLMNFKKSGIRWSQPYQSPTLSTDTPCPEAERLVTTVNVTPKTTNSNSLLPNTA